jgi:hypothetical protein
MILNTRVFPKHLDRDINKIFFDDYNARTPEYPMLVEVEMAPPGNHYTEAELSILGGLREIPEGDGVTFDNPIEGNEITRYYEEYGLGIQITHQMVSDDLTGNFRKLPKKLSKSANDKVEAKTADLFNSGFTVHTAWDSNFIFYDTRSTLKSGDTIDNSGTAASLSETSLIAAFEYFDTLVDSAGYPIMAMPNRLCVPTALRATAERLLRTPGVVGSANNELNMVGPQGFFGPQLFVSHYFTSDTAWFVLSDLWDGRLYWKEKFYMESADDFFTGNALFKVVGRFVPFVNNPIGGYGNTGA